jgi:hypothetical protein
VKDVPAFLDLPHGGAPPDHPLRQRKGHARHAPHHAGGGLVQGTCATWVHCGDSRLYVVRDGELLTRTRDHSYLEQQSAGVIKHGPHQPQHPVHLPGLAHQARCLT